MNTLSSAFEALGRLFSHPTYGPVARHLVRTATLEFSRYMRSQARKPRRTQTIS